MHSEILDWILDNTKAPIDLREYLESYIVETIQVIRIDTGDTIQLDGNLILSLYPPDPWGNGKVAFYLEGKNFIEFCELEDRVVTGKTKSPVLTGLEDMANSSRYRPASPPHTRRDAFIPKFEDISKDHNVTLIKDVRPIKYDLTWNHQLPSHTVAFTCSCVDGWFCPKVRSEISRVIATRRWDVLILNNSVQFLLPVFGNVLHRIELERTIRDDWEGNGVDQVIVRPLVYPGLDDENYLETSYLSETDGKVLTDLIVQIERDFLSDTNTLEILNSGPRGVILYSTQNCKSKAHSSFGSQQRLTEVLGHEPHLSPPIIQKDKMSAMMFTSFNYGICYSCYMASESAFWLAALPD